jgi:hypothetical protein
MIKNKDGNQYKISRPNPLMKNQDLWEIYTTHNFVWESIVIKSKELEAETEVELIPEPITEKIKIDPEEVKVIPIKEDIPIIKEKLKDLEEAHLLTAENIINKDELYNQDIKVTIKYEKQKTILIKIEFYNDLNLVFESKEEITKNSVVFPKNKNKRWWKILKVNKKENMFSCSCIPSDFTPSFD